MEGNLWWLNTAHVKGHSKDICQKRKLGLLHLRFNSTFSKKSRRKSRTYCEEINVSFKTLFLLVNDPDHSLRKVDIDHHMRGLE